PLPLPSLRRRRRCPVQATVLHAVGMGNRPYDKRCCPRAAPCGRTVPPYAGAAPVGAATLASDSPGREVALCSLTAGSRPLRPGHGRCLR
ncbi:hypothetical protein BHM03_00028039, partial [Ensete ventricosum]